MDTLGLAIRWVLLFRKLRKLLLGRPNLENLPVHSYNRILQQGLKVAVIVCSGSKGKKDAIKRAMARLAEEKPR
jgi:hypothetical protein